MATTSPVLRLYERTTRLPLGHRVFSRLFSLKAPYFASVRPLFVEVRPDYVELVVRKRRRVLNHIGTVHVIAICNGLEAAMGALAEVSIPPHKRWIPKGMEVSYTAKATSDITCVAERPTTRSGPATTRTCLSACVASAMTARSWSRASSGCG